MTQVEQSEIAIDRAKVQDAAEIAYVQSLSWIDTYRRPNDRERTQEALFIAASYLIPERIEIRKQRIARAEANPDQELYLSARYNDRITGLLYGEKMDELQDIQVLYVDSDYHGRGISRALVKRYLTRADDSRPVQLGVISDNYGAQDFYSKMGFSAVPHSLHSFTHASTMMEITMERPAAMHFNETGGTA